jgi:hypothetical protein
MGCTAVLALGIAACSDDPVGRAPALDAEAVGEPSLLRNDGEQEISQILVLDDCDPNDPAWAPTGGCTLKNGRVTNREFNELLVSPLTIPPFLSVIGHPAWRNEPSYIDIFTGKSVKVTNAGGRAHTFTEVAQFGGGRVPPLNLGLTPAPECLVPGPNLLPGATMRIENLGVGIHRFQCCIHPWMRGLVAVSDKGHEHE